MAEGLAGDEVEVVVEEDLFDVEEGRQEEEEDDEGISSAAMRICLTSGSQETSDTPIHRGKG